MSNRSHTITQGEPTQVGIEAQIMDILMGELSVTDGGLIEGERNAARAIVALLSSRPTPSEPHIDPNTVERCARVVDALAKEAEERAKLCASTEDLYQREFTVARRLREASSFIRSLLTDGRPKQFIDIVFDGPPSHESGRFVEVENEHGQSIKVGDWIDRGNGLWALRIARPTPSSPSAGEGIEANLAEILLAETDIRRWQRHWLLRQYSDDGHVLAQNLELSKHIDVLFNALRGGAVPAADGWRSMESAPTTIITFDGALSADERYNRGVLDCIGTDEEGSPIVLARDAITGKALHWCKLRPLPAPPAAREKP